MAKKIIGWMQIARLQFYPMSIIAYSIGTLLSSSFNLGVFIVGYVVLFFIEFATVMTNEYFDYPSDKVNQNFSPFNGGSRVIVDGKLTFSEVKTGIVVVLGLTVILGIALGFMVQASSILPMLVLVIIGLFLGLGYTVPPIKLSYRGLGEIDVALTHSLYLVFCGYLFQGGAWHNKLPWLLSLPILFATLGAISLSNLPDSEADKSVGRRTMAVLLGPKRTALFAMFSIFAAVSIAIVLTVFKITPLILIIISIPHAILLAFAIMRLLKSGNLTGRINGIMQLALSYILWFGLFPLISLLRK